MAEQLGKLLTCDRCGATTFVKYTGEKELDGGFTRYNTFEKPPDGWKASTELNMKLCPECNSTWETYKNEFLKR